MYGYVGLVGLCMAMYVYVWLCRAMCGYVGLCLSMYGYVGPGAHYPERATTINSCNGVFTSEFIFR